MAVTVVVGSQWGDEGKGKIVDLLAPQYDIVARYQGGANAGHTIQWDDHTHVLHLIPSGAFAPDVTCVIGNGVVVDPATLVREIMAVRDLGYALEGRLWIAYNAHCILPYHLAVDKTSELASGDKAIGTTCRGIGPAYVDKVARRGIRMGDFLDVDRLVRKLKAAVNEKNRLLVNVYGANSLDVDEIIDTYLHFGFILAPFITDTTALLHDALATGKTILAEGAQGSLLDLDFGTYPYVTSSNPTAGGACTGLGIPPKAIDRVVGITKAYCTRVGNGPFPTELSGAIGEYLRQAGVEFGATTGRSRRCGWLDLMALRYACQLNGFTELVITKIDVLTGLKTVDVCTDYELETGNNTRFIGEVSKLRRVKPNYTSIPGWTECIMGVSAYEQLPKSAKALVRLIADYTQVQISMISTGPKRHQIVTIDG